MSKVSWSDGSELANLNVRGLRDSSKCARLLGEFKNLGGDVAAVQETHFTCGADSCVLESDFNVFSAYGSRISVGVSLLVGRSLDVDVVFAGDGDRLVVADVAVKSFKFCLVAVHAPNIIVERVSFFRQLAPFLDDTKRLVLMVVFHNCVAGHECYFKYFFIRNNSSPSIGVLQKTNIIYKFKCL